MLTAEQLLATHKANVATLFDLGQKAFEGVEKVLELNLQVAKTTLDEVAEHTKSVLAVKDATSGSSSTTKALRCMCPPAFHGNRAFQNHASRLGKSRPGASCAG